MSKKRGLRIVVEGGDASGKNTQTRNLTNYLTDDLELLAKRFSFPRYETTVGALIGRFLREEVTLNTTAKADPPMTEDAKRLADSELIQALMLYDRCGGYLQMEAVIDQGGYAVCDRLWPSGVLYGRVMEGLKDESMIDEGFFMPADLYILLDLPAEMAMARRPVARDKNEEKLHLRQEIRRAYLDLWAKKAFDHPVHWNVVDASKSPVEVFAAIRQIVDPFVKLTTLANSLISQQESSK